MKTNSLLIILLFFSLFHIQAEGKTVVGNPRFPRKALVAPDCLINDLINVVKVGSGTSGLNNLLDENIDNYATLGGLAGVGALVDPVIRVKDRENYYPAGTVAGFCIQSEAGSKLLSLDLLKGLSMMLYKDGTLQETIAVEQGQGAVLKLDLIQISTSNQVNTFLTVTSTKEFDEVGFAATGVNVDALEALKVKYAFVGDAQDMPLITKNVPGIEAGLIAPTPLFKNRLIDDDLTNHATSTGLLGLVDVGATVSLSWEKEYPKGTKVGFVFADVNILNLGLLNTFTIRLTDKNGKSTSTVINTTVLGLSLIGAEQRDVSILATQAFNKVELIIGGLGVSASGREYYYGYIQNPPLVAHNHNLGLSADATLCDNETAYQLSADETVTWSLVSKPDGDNTVTVDASTGAVTNMTPGVTGDYVFRATASDGCTGTVTITKGVTITIDPDCNRPLNENVELSTQVYDSSGSLLTIDNLKNKENITDASMSTYAEYTGGVTLATNIQIVGVKQTSSAATKWNSGTQGSRVGFVVEANQTLLNADVLEFFRVRLYNSATGTYVHESVIDNSNVVSAGLIGGDPAAKVRYSIQVPADTEFDEITLWKSGVLSVGLSTLRIYGAFIEDASLNCYSDDPLGCSSTLISTGDGAHINYDATGFTGLVNAAAVLLNLEKLIDNDITTYTHTTGIQVGSQTAIAVKLGREYNHTHQVGIVIDKTTWLAGVKLANWMTLETFYDGRSTGDKQTSWEVLGLDAIGYGDKVYLILRPRATYDEIRISATGLASVLDATKLYGIFVRNDTDGDGVPDCGDEESCPDDNTTLTDVALTRHICQNNSITITGKGVAGNSYTLSCPAQGIASLSVTIENADGTFSWSYGPMPNSGHFSLIIQDKNGRVVSNPSFTVHPLLTTWKQSPGDTDWNNWDNWTNGSPLTCTNVIIPSNCDTYPVLTSTGADANGCANIHFEAGAEVLKTHLLTYTKASVDLTLTPDRYYMLSAPLKSMVTGDMFIPIDGNPAVFTPANASSAPQNRFNPRIYQRIWANNAKGQSLTNNNVVVAPDETRWTPPFNALAEAYRMGEGFSLKAVQGAATSPLTFRFPKEHTEYEYVGGDNVPTGIKETITRTDAGRFIHDGNTLPFSVTLTNKESGTVFLAGNPFMSHIDIAAFLKANSSITSVKVYDGNSSNSLILANGQLLSSETNYTKIAPMQSFFITTAGTSNAQSVTYTEDMLVTGGGNQLRSASAPDPVTLLLAANTGSYTAKAMLRINPDASDRYVAGEDAEILIDNEVRPVIVLFSVADGKALDIQQVSESAEIPLGFHLERPAAVSLSISHAGQGLWTGWSLLDAQTGKRYPLDSTAAIDLGLLSTNIGRFFLKNEVATGNEFPELSGNRIYCSRMDASEQVVVRSTTEQMSRCEVYSITGERIDRAAYAASEYRLRLTQGVNLIKVGLPDGTSQVFKLSCF